jgi:hypothetical protein
MAGRIQMRAGGITTDILTSQPEFSYFSTKYAKYTNFSKNRVKIKPDGDKVVKTGDELNFSIYQNIGDVITGMSLSFEISAPPTGNQLHHIVDRFGLSVFEYIDIYLGDQLLNRVTSDDLNIYNSTSTLSTYNRTNDMLHGSQFHPTRYNADNYTYRPSYFLYNSYWVNGQFARPIESFVYAGRSLLNSHNLTNFIVDIPFRPFHLHLIKYQELKLNIKIRNGREVIFPAKTIDHANKGGFPVAEWDYQNDYDIPDFQLSNFKLNIDVAYLDKIEREKMKNKCYMFLVDKNQHNTFSMGNTETTGTYDLKFKNCVKELFFIAKKRYSVLNQWSTMPILHTYTTFTPDRSVPPQKPVPCIYIRQKHVTLSCDGLPILDDTTGSHQFLSTHIPDIYHKQTPYESNLTMYSFAVNPDKHEPSGYVNFSMFKDVKLEMVLSGAASYYEFIKDIIVIAKSYNILRIKDGVGKLLF